MKLGMRKASLHALQLEKCFAPALDPHLSGPIPPRWRTGGAAKQPVSQANAVAAPLQQSTWCCNCRDG
jgi:hypothetical protein